MTRLFDISCALVLLVGLFPFFILIAFLVVASSRGGGFYCQKRVGLNGKDFQLLKFRTMYKGSDKQGLLTIGDRDHRITFIGYYLRKYKLDELPQLVNVLKGDMSMVGPRPEVRKYVQLYSTEQLQVLSVKPGITDYASIKFRHEAELMSKSDSPEYYYIQTIMPIKLGYSIEYIRRKNILEDIKIMALTIKCILLKDSSNRNLL